MGDPSKPIPNGDPDCHCLLNPEAVPKGYVMMKLSLGDLGDSTVACDPGCPHHGHMVMAMQQDAATAVSLWPSRPPGDDAAARLLRDIFGSQEPPPGPPFTHTLRLPETEQEMAAEPGASFTITEDEP